ncbi:hypothetical protein ACIO93_05905 [Streptomyces sp. NPDC087903]|uniref:hypothetical protein n=1 Tax=Streptomyces sp. NPDC087903 TaxID=3365819 RepID=UPI0037FA577D
MVRPEYAEDPLFRKRFEREVSALGRVQGAHTARLAGSGTDGELVWVATEYIPGPTLAEAVDERSARRPGSCCTTGLPVRCGPARSP